MTPLYRRIRWSGAFQGGEMLVDLRPKDVRAWLDDEVEQPHQPGDFSIRRKPFHGMVGDSHFRMRRGRSNIAAQLEGVFHQTEDGTLIEFVVGPDWSAQVGLALILLGWVVVNSYIIWDMKYGIPGPLPGFTAIVNIALVSFIGMGTLLGVISNTRSNTRDLIRRLQRIFDEAIIEQSLPSLPPIPIRLIQSFMNYRNPLKLREFWKAVKISWCGGCCDGRLLVDMDPARAWEKLRHIFDPRLWEEGRLVRGPMRYRGIIEEGQFRMCRNSFRGKIGPQLVGQIRQVEIGTVIEFCGRASLECSGVGSTYGTRYGCFSSFVVFEHIVFGSPWRCRR